MIKLSNGYEFEYTTASGSLGFRLKGWPWERLLVWLGFIKPELFANVIKTLTRYDRKGNLRWYKPWTCVRLISGGAVNKIGLTNKGIEWWCREKAAKINFEMIKVDGSIFGTTDELVYMAKKLKDFPLVALEINHSCPNTGNHLEETRAIVDGTRMLKAATNCPLILKLSVNQDYLEIARELYGTVEAISFNSVPWETVFPKKRSPLWRLEKKVGGGGGGVSGKPIQILNWRAIGELYTQHLVPVIASSIMCREDIDTVRALGAKAISFGTTHLPSYPIWLKPWTIFTNPCRPTNWAQKTKIRPSKIFVTMTMTLLSFLSAVACIIPIILPSFFAYVFGFNSYRDKIKHGITIVHVFVSIIIGELIFSAFIALFLNALIGLHNHPGAFWSIVIVFALNYLCSAIFYFIGTRQAMTGKKQS